MNSRSTAAPVAVLLAILVLGGCGGSGDDDGSPPPLGAVFTITGRVQEADHVSIGIGQSVITALPSGRTTTTASDGTFTLTNVPVDSVTLNCNPERTPSYQPAAILIPTPVANSVVNVTISLLPLTAPALTGLALSPLDATVEIGSTTQFLATVQTATGPIAYAASWVSLGSAGTLDSTGLFTATALGQNHIYAFSGTLGATTTITVVGQRGPFLDSLIVNPEQVSASGGVVTFTVAVHDGQGVASVDATVHTPGGADVVVALTRVAGDAFDATFRATYVVPPNSKPILGDGSQESQTYNVRFTATDVTARQTTSNRILFVVEGLAPPPPPPAP
jgi:hypothetical protein